LRLDLFLKRVGLVKQRLLAKQLCEQGSVRLNGRAGKAGKEIKPGDVIELDLYRERLEFKVVDIPHRNYKRTQGTQFYHVLRHEHKDPYL